MDSYGEVLVEDLIEYNADDSENISRSCWTEQALDLFISVLKNANRSNYSTQREMLEVISRKMSERGYQFNVEQVEKKYNSLKKMYMEKKERNQSVEPELAKMFGSSRAPSPMQQSSPSEPPQKKLKMEIPEASIVILDDDSDEKKVLWTPEATKLFLSLLEEMRPQLGTKLRTKKLMWEEICKRLKTHGFVFTYPQVENKWKALLRHYRSRMELMRNGVAVRPGTWPDFFETAMVKNSAAMEISFANDQKLPYEDDGYEDEEPYRLEDASQLPDIEVITDDVDPALIDEAAPPSNRQDQPSTTASEPLNPPDSIPELDRLIKEICGFREDNQRYQTELISLKKMKLSAYKQRTEQFSRIADELGGLMAYLKRKPGNVHL